MSDLERQFYLRLEKLVDRALASMKSYLAPTKSSAANCATNATRNLDFQR
jgi:hypothetical protein